MRRHSLTPAPSATPKRKASVIVYLAAAFAITIAALSAVVVYTSNSAFHRERSRAVDKARSAVRLVAIGYEREIKETPEGAKSILDIPELAGLDPAVCNPFMQKLVEWPHGHVSFVLPDGSIICSNKKEAVKAGRPYAGASWLKDGLAGKEIVITEPARDAITGNIGVASVLPFTSTSGKRAVLYMLSEMENFYTLTTPEIQLGTEILVLDRHRTIVLDRSAARTRYAGKSISGTTLSKPIPAGGAIVRGVDGVERVYADRVIPSSGWHVLSGIPTSIAFADARSQRVRSAALGVASILLVMALGFVLHRRIVKPVRSLTRAIEAAASDPEAVAPADGPAEIARVALTFNDMNEKRRRSEARFSALVLHASDMIAVLDPDGMIRYCSPAAHRLTGLPESSLIGVPFSSLVADDDRARAGAALATASRREGLGDPVEFGIRHSDGSIRQVEALLNNLTADPSVEGVVITMRDITERKAFEKHLSHQALHDALTDLPNRALALDRLTHALARAKRSKSMIGVLFMDLDRFKLINDSHGHAAGDQILVMLADRLSGAVRPSDTVARFGGDEFVALCENLTDEAQAIEVAERMADALREPFRIGDQDLFLSGSIGIALSGRGESAEELLGNADAAMYRAKERGRAGHALFDEGMRSNAVNRLLTEAALHRAIEKKSFVLHYQPKISLADGRVVGAEALIRMVDAERGIIPPAEFIEVAEDTGLIVPIGEMALMEACRQARTWRDVDGNPIPISVNISPRQLAQPSLPDVVKRVLEETGLSPQLLILEITENLLMQDSALAAVTLSKLRAIGVRVSIDDFGTGHSSLGYLQTFPIDELKIDRSFVAAMDEDPRSQTIVGSVVGLAHAIGLSVVAEGIETAAQLSELRRLGCDVGQGFYFSRPRHTEEIQELLASDALWGTTARPHATTAH